MSFKQKIEENLVLTVLGLLLTGFLGGMGTYNWLQNLLGKQSIASPLENGSNKYFQETASPIYSPNAFDVASLSNSFLFVTNQNLIETKSTPPESANANSIINSNSTNITYRQLNNDNFLRTDPESLSRWLFTFASQRKQAMTEVDQDCAQLAEMAYGVRQNSFALRYVGQNITTELIHQGLDIMGDYAETLRQISKSNLKAYRDISDHYDNIANQMITLPIDQYHTLLIQSPASISNLDAVVEEISQYDRKSSLWNSNATSIIQAYLNSK